MIGSSANQPNWPPSPGIQPTTHAEYVHRAAWKAGVLGALNVVTILLAVRLILFVAVAAAFALAYLAVQNGNPYSMGALTIYATVVVVPLIWLASRR